MSNLNIMGRSACINVQLNVSPVGRAGRRLLAAASCLTTLVLAASQLAPPREPRYRTQPLSQLELPCDLRALNEEYVAALNFKRQQLTPGAPLVHFDGQQLAGAFLQAYQQERYDSLYHELPPRCPELCGVILHADKYHDQPRQLARYIWTRFHESPPHDAIQRNPELVYVSVCCLNDFFVVRLSSTPWGHDKALYRRFQGVLLPIQAYTATHHPSSTR